MTHRANDITRATVIKHANRGVPQLEIAKLLGISPTTLRKHYEDQLQRGEAEAHAAVVGKLFETAMSGNVTALIFWCKTRLGWREAKDAPDRIPDTPLIPAESMAEILKLMPIPGIEIDARPYEDAQDVAFPALSKPKQLADVLG